MKIKLTGLLILFTFLSTAQQASHMRLLSHWNDTSLARIDGDQLWSDLTAWHDSAKNREYIIAGGNDSIYFFDITNPAKITLVAVEEGHSRKAINRDFETYQHYVYCVSDRTSPLGALQIFDLKYLPDSVHKVYDKDELGLQSHTIFIEEKSKRLYMCSNSLPTSSGGGIRAMDIISLANPENPVKISTLKNTTVGKVHEMYARNDTAYLSCEYNGLFIFDLRDTANQTQIGSITQYPKQGFNHSSWLDASGKKIMFTDENQGLDIKIADITDPQNPKFEPTFNSNVGALPHNAFWKGNLAIASCYEDGVVIFDVSDTKNPKKIAWYDTYLKNNPGEYHGFHGCWGVYPFLPSGIIVASDISEGIFVLKYDSAVGVSEADRENLKVSAYPNPFSNFIRVEASFSSKKVALKIVDISGATQLEIDNYTSTQPIDLSRLHAGIYFLRVELDNLSQNIKLVKAE